MPTIIVPFALTVGALIIRDERRERRNRRRILVIVRSEQTRTATYRRLLEGTEPFRDETMFRPKRLPGYLQQLAREGFLAALHLGAFNAQRAAYTLTDKGQADLPKEK